MSWVIITKPSTRQQVWLAEAVQPINLWNSSLPLSKGGSIWQIMTPQHLITKKETGAVTGSNQ
jgi:hypothetical protein